ncbi:MAG TPA: caspase family protein, partial [Kofleriaceae bacterium]|nr:caspase family protein [Kofleriaceae bacterium]
MTPRTLATALLVLTAAATPAAAGNGESLRRYAVIVGSNHGGPDREVLRYAGSDAESMARVLRELGGLRGDDVSLVREPDARALDAAFTDVARRIRGQRVAGQRVELMVYYSGHADDEGILLGGDRYGYDRLRRKIRAVPADVHIAIVDSCASGSFTRIKGGTRRPAFLQGDSNRVRGHAFLSSSSADENAQESDRIAASFFTHFLVAGLRGAGDRDRDRVVTLTEAYQFAYEQTVVRTQTTARGAQHPAYDMHLSGAGNIVMTDLRSTDSVLVLPAELSGRVTITDAHGRVVVEVTKAAGEPLSLALPGETYTVHVRHERDRFVATVTLTTTGEVVLERGDLERVALEGTVARGDDDGDDDEVSVEIGDAGESHDDRDNEGFLTQVRMSFGGGMRLELPGEGERPDEATPDSILTVGGAYRDVHAHDLVGAATTGELSLGAALGDHAGFAYDMSLGVGPGVILSDQLQLGATVGFGFGGITGDNLDFAWKVPTELFAVLELTPTVRALAYATQTFLYKSDARQDGSDLARWGDQTELGVGLRFTGPRKGFLYGSVREM